MCFYRMLGALQGISQQPGEVGTVIPFYNRGKYRYFKNCALGPQVIKPRAEIGAQAVWF